MTTDKEHLQWILNRLAEVHGENRNVDYMVRMKKIVDNIKTDTTNSKPICSKCKESTPPHGQCCNQFCSQ